jgi:hypothetical protein
MVDPGIGLDQGGNPLQEGVWATVDGGFQPKQKRDESYAKVANGLPPHVFTMPAGMIHNGVRMPLALFDTHIDGVPIRDESRWQELFMKHGGNYYNEANEPITVAVHDPAHASAVRELIQNGENIMSPRAMSSAAPHAFEVLKGIAAGTVPPPPGVNPAQLKFGSTKTANDFGWGGGDDMSFDFSEKNPTHKFVVDHLGRVYSMPNPIHHEDIADAHDLHAHGYPKRMSLGELFDDGSTDWYQHDSPLSAGAMGSALHGHFGFPINIDPNLKPTTNEERWGIGNPRWSEPMNDQHSKDLLFMNPDRRQQMEDAEAQRGKPFGYYNNPYINRGGSTRVLNQEPYMPWTVETSNERIAGFAAPLLEAAGPLVARFGPALMRGALRGVGSGLVQNAMGGTQDAQGQQPSMPPRDVSQLSSVREADLETPHGNPGYYHDDPEQIDQKEFNSGDHDPNLANPNLDDSGASGEDNVIQGFQDNSPALERLQMLAPLLMHYHNDPEKSGEQDPMILALHHQMDAEVPGYLDQVGPEHESALEQWLQQQRRPDAVHASVKEAIGPGMGLHQLNYPAQQPQGVPAGNGQGGQRCPNCGGVVTADGSCPQCGFKVNGMGGAQQATGLMSMPASPAANAFGTVPRMAADHQGPVTDEQKSAVSQLLIQQGRQHEIPQMLQEPWNYAKELAEVTNSPNVAPNVDPNEQPPQPAQEVAPPGATMPVPNPADPSAPQPQQMMGKTATPHNGAPRCPKCGSSTTGFVADDGSGQLQCSCHSCHNVWKADGDSVHTADAQVAPADPNVVGVPAADQDQQQISENDQDSSHTWQDDSGAPLQAGQKYEMHSPAYTIPDIVRIDKVKPDALVVSTIGEFSNEGEQPLEYQHEIPKEEADLQQLTFVPSDGSDDPGNQSLEDYRQQDSQAPVNTEPTQAVGDGSEYHSSVQESSEDLCPKCSSDHVTSSMSSATSSFHECFRCGHGWETREEDYADHNTAHRSWLMDESGPGGDDFFAEMQRHQAMREAGMSSRSLADIASRDNRLQEIKGLLSANGEERALHTAGKKYTPSQQREFIDERGAARNADKLDLAGTHYEGSHRYIDEKANGSNVPTEHLFIGLM